MAEFLYYEKLKESCIKETESIELLSDEPVPDSMERVDTAVSTSGKPLVERNTNQAADTSASAKTRTTPVDTPTYEGFTGLMKYLQSCNYAKVISILGGPLTCEKLWNTRFICAEIHSINDSLVSNSFPVYL